MRGEGRTSLLGTCASPGRDFREITLDVGPSGAFAANRVIFSSEYSERARAADTCTYQVCMLTPSGHKVVFSQRLL